VLVYLKPPDADVRHSQRKPERADRYKLAHLHEQSAAHCDIANDASSHRPKDRKNQNQVSADTVEQNKLAALECRYELKTGQKGARNDGYDVETIGGAMEAMVIPVAFTRDVEVGPTADSVVEVPVQALDAEKHHQTAKYEEESRPGAVREAKGSEEAPGP